MIVCDFGTCYVFLNTLLDHVDSGTGTRNLLCSEGDLLKGIDNKTVRRQGISTVAPFVYIHMSQ